MSMWQSEQTNKIFFSNCAQCQLPSVRSEGCDHCGGHFCQEHLSHGCPQDTVRKSNIDYITRDAEKILDEDDSTWNSHRESEICQLRSLINDEAACALASSLNDDKTCTLNHADLDKLPMGCANYHAYIEFEDGSKWLMRVPRVTRCSVNLSRDLAAYLIRSEFATLRFLSDHTLIPVPRVYDYGIFGERHIDIGVTFMFMEELPGKPYPYTPTPEQKQKWLAGVANILLELSHHPFNRAGSLLPDDSSTVIGPVASDRWVVLSPITGPFDKAIDYYQSWSKQYCDLIKEGQLYVEWPADAYLVYHFLHENAWQLVDSTRSTETATEKFFLKHIDDKGDHILVDKDFNITGVIDWQMARIVPEAEAFGPSLASADMKALSCGQLGLTADDNTVANCLEQNRIIGSYTRDEKIRRFFWGLALEKKWTRALPLAEALLRLFDADDKNWITWRQKRIMTLGQDEPLKSLIKRQDLLNTSK